MPRAGDERIAAAERGERGGAGEVGGDAGLEPEPARRFLHLVVADEDDLVHRVADRSRRCARRFRRQAMVATRVVTSGKAIQRPASRLAFRVGEPVGSMPTMRISGRRARTAVASPAIRPPPPMATRMVSTPAMSSRISSPSVPWPATTSGSAKGWK